MDEKENKDQPRQGLETKQLEHAEFIPANLNRSIVDHLGFQQAEIVGLGECTHGSKTIITCR